MVRLVHVGKTLIAAALVGCGLLRLVHRWRRPHVLVLAYHRVTPDAALGDCAYPAMHVSRSTFARQLQALRELYRPIPMSELETLLAGRAPLREHVAVVTFDDGYRDNYQEALPVLAEHGVPATFFLSVDFVDGEKRFWFDELADAVRAWDENEAVRTRGREVLPAALVAALARPGSLQERLRLAAAVLKRLPDGERSAIVHTFSSLAGTSAAAPGGEPLGWEEVRDLHRRGMRIGAHGIRHGILTRMPEEAAQREIRGSVQRIEARTGIAVQEFAYPNGDASAAVAQRAAESGIRLAFTMDPVAVQPGDDPLRLGRRNMSEDSSRAAFGGFSKAYFWCEITGVFDVLLRRRTRKSSHA